MNRYLCQLCDTIVSYGDNHPCVCHKNDCEVYSIHHSAGSDYARQEEAIENLPANYEILFPKTLLNDTVDTEILEENLLDRKRQFLLSYEKWLKCVSKNFDNESHGNLYNNPPSGSFLNDPLNIIPSNENQTAYFRKLSASLDYVYKFTDNNRGASRRKSKPKKIFKELNEEIESDRSSFLPEKKSKPKKIFKELNKEMESDRSSFQPENNSDLTAETHLFDVPVTPEVTAKSFNSSEFHITNANVPIISIESSRINLPFNRESGKGKSVYNLCDKEFKIKSEFDFHFQNHTEEKRFRCDVCKKEFIRKKDLEKHHSTHTRLKRFMCDVCQKRFFRKGQLIMHCRKHTGEKPFECNVCKKAFTRKGTLRRHCRIHTGEGSLECDVCKKRFITKDKLKIHYRTHTGEKPFECDVCKRAFAHKGTLRRHCRIHNVEMPFECDVCNKRVITKEKLKNHYITHTKKKTFVCDKCPKSFAFKSRLARHSKTHEDEKH